jgi:hypothetical protein
MAKISFMDGFKFGLGFTAAGAVVGGVAALVGSALGIAFLKRTSAGTAGFNSYEFEASEARRIGQTEMPEEEFKMNPKLSAYEMDSERRRIGEYEMDSERRRIGEYEMDSEERRIGAAATPQDEFPSMSLRGEGDEFE